MQEHTPIPTPLAQRVEDFKHRTLPLVVWILASVVVAVMLAQRSREVEYIGLAHFAEYEISANVNGVLESVVVDLYDDVASGDVLVRLDDTVVQARVATARASVGKLTADLEAARAELLAAVGRGLADWTADLRRFQIDEESRRLDLLELKVVIESGQIELERLALELRRAEPQFEAGFIGQAEYDDIRLTHDQVRGQIEDNRVLLEQMEREYRTTRERRLEFEQSLPRAPEEGPLLQPLREAIEVENRRLDEIESLRAELVLRSPVAGQVSRVLGHRGQAVVPGEPILTVAERSVQEIVAYLAESDRSAVGVDTPVRLARQGSGGGVAESVVLRVGPTVEMLPQRLWRDPVVPDYGRAVVIAAAPRLGLTPGERVRVRFLPPE